MSIDRADLQMQVQTSLEKKALKQHSENVLKLIQSVTDGEVKKSEGVKQSISGNRVNLKA